jgi:fumarate hydratase class II
MADAMQSFKAPCVRGIVANRERIAELLERFLLLVTVLASHIGCDRTAVRGVLTGAQTRSRAQARIACVTRPGDPDPNP